MIASLEFYHRVVMRTMRPLGRHSARHPTLRSPGPPNNPRSDLLGPAPSKTKPPLLSLSPILLKQRATHDSHQRVCILAQQDKPNFMRHDTAQTSRIKAAHEDDGAGVEGDAAAHRPDAIADRLRLRLQFDHKSGGIFGGWSHGVPPLCRICETVSPDQLNAGTPENIRRGVFGLLEYSLTDVRVIVDHKSKRQVVCGGNG